MLNAATITSKPTGGTYSTAATWVGNILPKTTDDVVIATTGTSKVTVSGNTTCASLTVNLGSNLTTNNKTLTVNGAVTNNGAIVCTTGGITQASTSDFTNSGTITLTSGKITQNNNANFINSGSITFSAAGRLYLRSNFTNTGVLSLGTTAVYFTGNNAANSNVAGFSTTGTVYQQRTAGTITFTSNVTGVILSLTGAGTLNLGTALEHTFTGAITQSAGTLDGGSSKLYARATGTAWNYNGGTFNPNQGTFVFDRSGTQSIGGSKNSTFNNLTLGGTSLKTLSRVPTVNGILSMEGTATVSAAPTFGAASTIQYYGTGRTISTEFPAAFAGTGGVIIDPGNGNTVILNANKTSFKGDLHLLSGTFDLAANSIDHVVVPAGGTLSLAANTTLKIGGATFPANYVTHSIDALSTVEYDGVTQTVAGLKSSQGYGNLYLSGSGTKTLEATMIPINGNFVNNGVTVNSTGNTLTFNGSIAQTIDGTTTTFNDMVFNNTNGVTMNIGETVNGDFTIGSGANVTLGNFSHNLGGNFVNNGGTLIATGSTLTLNGASAQTIGGSTSSTFNNLTFNNTSGVSMTIGETVNGTFTVSSEASFTTGAFSHALKGNFVNNGSTFTTTGSTLTFNGTSAQTIGGSSSTTFNNLTVSNSSGVSMTIGETINGTFTVSSGASFTTGALSHALKGNFVNNGSTFTATGSTLTINGTSAQTIGGTSATTFNNLTISNTSGVSMTIGETVNGTFTVSSGASFTTGAFSHALKGNFVNNGSTFTTTGSTLTFNGTSAQTIGGSTSTTFNNLTISNTSGVTMTTGETVNGTFTVSPGAAFTTGALSHTFKGDFVNNGSTLNATGSTLIFNGISAQTIGGSSATTFNNLTLNNSNGITLSIGQTVNGVLTLSNGLLNTGSNTLTVGCSGSIANASAARYVNGKLALVFCSTGARVFPIGKGGNYRPLTLNYKALTGASTVTAEQIESTLPGTIPSDITIFGSRYWQLSQTGGSSYSFILTLDGTGWSPTSYFKMLKGDGSTNVHYAVTTPNYTNSAAFTSFGNFGLGQLSFVTWIGSTSDWFTTSNWSSGALPTSTDDIRIPSTVTNYPTISSTGSDISIASAGKLQVQAGASLTLESGPLLTFQSGATVTTGSGSKIVLKSDARYLNLSSSTPILEIQRQLTGTKGWRMLSSPVATTFSDMFKDSLVTQGFTGSDFITLQPNLLWWSESDPGTTLQSWRKPSNLTESIADGRGYFHYVFNGAGRLTANGTPTDTNYVDTLPLTMSVTGVENFNGIGVYGIKLTYTTKSSTQTLSPDSTYYDLNSLDQGWNLIGNPTASSLDWDATGWSKTNVDNTIYVWDPSALSGNGEYLTWNGSTGTLGSGKIAPFQAFWAHAIDTTTLTFTNAVKTDITGTFLRSSQTDETISLPITLSVGDLQTTSYLSFSEDGITGPDCKDAYQLQSMSDNWLELYSLSSAEYVSPLVINHLPILKDELITVPLYYDTQLNNSSSKQNYILNWKLPNNWPSDWKISLQDHKTETSISMTENSSYSFGDVSKSNVPTSETKLPLPQRLVQNLTSTSMLRSNSSLPPFTIVVSKGKEIDYMAPKPELLGNYPNPFEKYTTVRFSLPEKAKASVEVYSAQGLKIATLADGLFPAGITELKWDATSIPPGIYFIRFKSGESVETKKAILID